MALYRCTSGGGNTTGVTLWTNTNPSVDFAAQTITLSQDVSNFTKLRVNYCMGKTDTSKTSYFEFPTENVLDYLSHVGNTNYLCGAIVNEHYVNGAGDRFGTRYIYATASNKLYISSNGRYGANGSYDDYGIPTSIEGIK